MLKFAIVCRDGRDSWVIHYRSPDYESVQRDIRSANEANQRNGASLRYHLGESPRIIEYRRCKAEQEEADWIF